MAARVSTPDVDLSCPICHNIFKDPVLLSCSHSFCKKCLQHWWEEKLINQCPVCKRRSSRSDPPCNLALKNLCEAFSQDLSLQDKDRPETICTVHSEKLRLFCVEDLEPVCVVCRDSRAHANHRFSPIDEAAQVYKEELRKSLKPFQDKLELFSQVKVNWYQTAEHIEVQALHTERSIREHFKKLQDFLQKEEETRISAVREEEERKREMMKEKMEALDQDVAALSDTVRVTEKELRAEDTSFLQNYKTAVQRVQQRPLLDEPQLGPGALMDEAKHLGNLTYNIWINMKEMVSFSPVILDPNTAESSVIVSEDLTSMRRGMMVRELPRNPERFKNYVTVLGSEGFTSGTHSWDVAVSDEANWAVGVIEESVPRRNNMVTGYWELWFHDGDYRAYAPPRIDKVLSVQKPLERIRVNLDWRRGKLAFTNLDTNRVLHTFSHTFTEKLFPYINTVNTVPVQILPVTVTVKPEV